nr:helitron helicase-like domain-containing protein [Tanacetum cinerariifolium]
MIPCHEKSSSLPENYVPTNQGDYVEQSLNTPSLTLSPQESKRVEHLRRGSCSDANMGGTGGSCPNANDDVGTMSKRKCVSDYSSSGSSLLDIMGHSGTRSCNLNDRTECSGALSYHSRKHYLGSRFSRNSDDASGNTSSKRQQVCGDRDDQNASTLRNHPTSTGDCSSTPMDTFGSRVGYIGLTLEYKYVGSCEHCCQHCGARFWFLQLYLYDTENKVDNRMHHFGGDNSGLHRDIVEVLIELLDNHNALV